MSKLKELRLQARLSVSALARKADVDRQTVERAERGNPVQDVKAYAILSAINEALGQRFTFSDVEDLRIL